jgi:murein L,D-transpeptidase YafK
MRRLLLFSAVFLISNFVVAQSFKAEQQKSRRVKAAYSAKYEELKSALALKELRIDNLEIYIRIFKTEEKTEVWARNKGKGEYKLFKTYDICASSGIPGPKRKQGDGQVPEGFYNIKVFNPYSSYHLSMGINYPNESDRIIGKENLGGDIMIHGDCVTIGCIPLTDNYIKEVYLLAVEARNAGQKNIQVHIFPCRYGTSAWQSLKEKNSKNVKLISFWENLQSGYDMFEKGKMLPIVTVDKNGKYLFTEGKQ